MTTTATTGFIFAPSLRSFNVRNARRRLLFTTTTTAAQNNHPTTELKKADFYDAQNIFKFKSTWELFRSAIILKLCSVNILVDNSLQVSKHY